MTTPPSLIDNYNYADFVGAAISSALAVDWPDKEVIVVDDASTDDLRTVIDGFRGRATAYFRPKSYQLGAHMFGFEQSAGDVIIFLDPDDLVMREVAKVWRPGVFKGHEMIPALSGTPPAGVRVLIARVQCISGVAPIAWQRLCIGARAGPILPDGVRVPLEAGGPGEDAGL
jgi:glycosyltransferase involved in cell wall biosynthesis